MKKMNLIAMITACVLVSACGQGSSPADTGAADSGPDGGISYDGGLPQSLPFTFTRADEGEKIPEAEVTAFTKKITGMLKEIEYFKWVLRISHGWDGRDGMPEFAMWWHDVDPIKKGDTVTMHHGSRGGAHNPIVPTTKVLANAALGYMASGDPVMGRIVELFSKCITAQMKGMLFDKNDTEKYIMARNIIVRDHDYLIDGGRKKSVEVHDWFNEYAGWNAERWRYPDNPVWGDIYITNMRSKDDVPHIYVATDFLRYVVQYGKDENVRSAAAEAVEYMEGFGRDIVDNGYYIRSKDKNGKAYIPTTQDLASFVEYEWLDPKAECNAKLASALLGYGVQKGIGCGKGGINGYETAAVGQHYYNWEIVRTFHISSVLGSLVAGQNDVAKKLMQGLAERTDSYVHTEDEVFLKEAWFEGDLAVYLLESAAAGLPLTSREARLVQKIYSGAAGEFPGWGYWDLWSASVPDGRHEYQPWSVEKVAHVAAEDLSWVVAYCSSPFRNPNGARFVDCDIVRDPSRWGE